MRFVCDRCKSKYSISDDKVRGKILKIRCKRCNHIIEVRDPVAAHASATAAPLGPIRVTPAPERHPLDMPEEHTQLSSPGLLDELRRTAANLALQPSAEPVLSEWYVAIDDEPQGPVTREEIRGHVAAGRVGSESLVWREGFDDWRPLREVAELKDLLRGSRALAAVAAPPKTRGSGRATTTRQPAGGLAEVIPLRPGGEAPLDGGGRRERETDRPTLERLSPHHSPPPASPFAAPASGRVASPLRGRDVGRLGARTSASAVAHPFMDVEPAGVPTTPAPPPGAAFGAMASAGPPPPPPDPDAGLAGLVSAPPPRFDHADAEASVAFAIPPPPPPEAIAPVATASRAPSPSMLPMVQAATASRRRAMLFLAIAGAVVVGVVGAVVAVKLLAGPPSPPPGPAVAANPQPLVDPGPDPARPPASDPIKGLRAGPEGPDAGAVVDAGDDGGAGKARPAWRPPVGGGPTPGAKGKTLTEEELRLLEQAKALGAAGPVAAKSKSGGSGETTAARRGEPLSSAQVRATVGKNMGAIQSCYEREMRGAKMQRDLRVLVYMRIGTSGTVRTATIRTATVRGTALGNCIEGAIRRWRFPTATGETEVETPFVLTPRH